MVTSAILYHMAHFLHVTIDIRNVCVFLAPLFSSLTALTTYFLTKELKVWFCYMYVFCCGYFKMFFVHRSTKFLRHKWFNAMSWCSLDDVCHFVGSYFAVPNVSWAILDCEYCCRMPAPAWLQRVWFQLFPATFHAQWQARTITRVLQFSACSSRMRHGLSQWRQDLCTGVFSARWLTFTWLVLYKKKHTLGSTVSKIVNT